MSSSILDTTMAEIGLPRLLEQLGRQVTYTTAAGVASTLTAIVGPEEQTEQLDPAGGVLSVTVREITIAADPDGAYGGVADPAANDTLGVDGVLYAVGDAVGRSPVASILRARRIGRVEHTAPGYRGDA